MTRGGRRPGAGRKPIRDESAKHTIQVRVTDAEKRVLTEAAARDGETLSAWMRRIGLDKALR